MIAKMAREPRGSRAGVRPSVAIACIDPLWPDGIDVSHAAESALLRPARHPRRSRHLPPA